MRLYGCKSQGSSLISFKTNIASLRSERQLSGVTRELGAVFERLSSGLRINKASDDAGGLAIASSLDVDARVFAQGRRNLNDAVSLTNIAESALDSMSSILIRQRELATQAANGALSFKQRSALDAEFNELVDEYNRIVESVSFNNRSLFDLDDNSYNIQAGYGADGRITFSSGEEIARGVGDGTFGTPIATGVATDAIDVNDVNGDGIDDIITESGVMIGSEDSGFTVVTTSPASDVVTYDIATGDLNGDGFIDVARIFEDSSAGWFEVGVELGNGDGTFKAEVAYQTPFQSQLLTDYYDTLVVDVNGDGRDEVIFSSSGADAGYMFVNDDGSIDGFNSFGASANLKNISEGDFNNDGLVDFASTGNDTHIFLQNGDGSFTESIIVTASETENHRRFVADFNEDGIDDLAIRNVGNTDIYLGNGDGTFRLGESISGIPNTAIDVNGDGSTDLVLASAVSISVFLGNGDGTFSAPITSSPGVGNSLKRAFGDFNGDGALDIASGFGAVSYVLANPEFTTTIARQSIVSRQDALAAIPVIDRNLEKLSAERGAIGSVQSRLNVALNNLQIGEENYRAAASQIRDADLAAESARLVRSQILQQAGAAVLAQANTQPEIGLSLLS